jgi:acetyl-CoA carboxylase biotin carboxyl carrier protein
VSLTAADVAEIMRLVEQSNFDELILEMDCIKLCLRRGAPTAVVGLPGETSRGASDVSAPGTGHTAAAATAGSPPQPAANTFAAPKANSPPLATVAAPADPNVHDVASPLLGTFYRAPKPGASPFVEVGSQVEEGTVVAIIEVMKLMNTVRAGVRGTVTEILVADGALAEYGETLLRVRKAG